MKYRKNMKQVVATAKYLLSSRRCRNKVLCCHYLSKIYEFQEYSVSLSGFRSYINCHFPLKVKMKNHIRQLNPQKMLNFQQFKPVYQIKIVSLHRFPILSEASDSRKVYFD
jgi:hypothetical protein